MGGWTVIPVREARMVPGQREGKAVDRTWRNLGCGGGCRCCSCLGYEGNLGLQGWGFLRWASLGRWPWDMGP